METERERFSDITQKKVIGITIEEAKKWVKHTATVHDMKPFPNSRAHSIELMQQQQQNPHTKNARDLSSKTNRKFHEMRQRLMK